MKTQYSALFIKFVRSSLLVLATLLANVSFAQQANPQQLLEQATKTTFTRIEVEQHQINANPNHLRDIIEQELMPYVDHKFAAFKVLGNQFRSVPQDKIPEFIEQFRLYLISNFAVALSNYGGQQLVFAPVADYQNQKSMDIRAVIQTAGRPDIRINFKMRKSASTQEWKTYDLEAEGISLLSSKRNEFASTIRQQGIQAVIDLMQAKNNQELNITAKLN
ncbi:MlaC/ttg2D family ABC transporter substrate-binding protein [Paraglaciecola aestuariivivens]